MTMTEPTTPVTVLDAIVDLLRHEAETFNRNHEEASLAMLWPDPSSNWATLLPELRTHLPILTLGDYDTATRSGPAFWIRAALAGGAPDIDLREGTPIVYLPGFSVSDLRDAEHAPEPLQTLLYLRYRGTILTQVNGKDVTVAALLQNKDRGLGLRVDSDKATLESLPGSLPRLAQERLETLVGARINAAFIHRLHLPDLSRSILRWIDDESAFRSACSTEEWDSFCRVLRSDFALDPERDGTIQAARLLGEQASAPWKSTWDRFAEAPRAYPGLPDRLRAAKPADELPLFRHWAWPQDNEAAENDLRKALLKLDEHPDTARKTIANLELTHAPRRDTVWATMHQAPLATALRHLAAVAQGTTKPLAGVSLDVLIAAYTDWGWQVDAAALDALAAVSVHGEVFENRAAVGLAVRRLTYGWLDAAAKAFQSLIGSSPPAAPAPEFAPGTCIVFADGLRYDLGATLAQRLTGQGLRVDIQHGICAIPGVTPTAKPAVAPLAEEWVPGKDFGVRKGNAMSNLTNPVYEKLLTERGWTVLRDHDVACPDPAARGWTEVGAFDSYGHNHPDDLPGERDRQLERVGDVVRALLGAGWAQVRVVTDHGWLYMPDGLAKTHLPEELTVSRKTRCARLKDHSRTDLQTLPWHWDPAVRIAFPPGISAFEEGKVYDHGGLSVQECVVPILTIAPAVNRRPVTIASVTWRGMRCDVHLAGGTDTYRLDIRLKPADAASSVLDAAVPVTGEKTTLVVADYDQEGMAASLVILDANGAIVAQRGVVIGQDAA